MRKTTIISLVLLLCFVGSGTIQAQKSFDNIYKKYKKEENVTGIKVNKLGCMMISLFAGKEDEDAKNFLKKSSSIQILVSENDNSDRMLKDVNRYINASKLEQLISVVDGDETVDIYILDRKDVIQQLFLVVSEKDEHVILNIEGRYPIKLIQKMISEDPNSILSVCKGNS